MIQQQPPGASGFQITPQLIAGLLIIFVGVVFTMDELGIAPATSYLRYWPTALIAIGVIKLLQARDGSGAFAGLIFTVVGLWLQAEELNLLHISLGDVWPIGLVVFGGYLVWQGLRARQPAQSRINAPPSDPFAPLPPLEDLGASSFGGLGSSPTSDVGSAAGSSAESTAREKRTRETDRGCSRRRSNDAQVRITDGNSRMNVMAILGAVTRGNNSKSFRAANLVAIMGGCEIDLRNAAIDGDAVIDVFAMWGGIEIRVPENWTVSSQVVPLMGGVEDKTRPPQGATAHRLTLRGAAFMGGIEIKN